MQGPNLSDPRDVREFREAKRIKREPIHFNAFPVAEAEFVPRDAASFRRFRADLIGASDWGQTSEGIERLAAELMRRHQTELPVPQRVMQNSDRSISLAWGHAFARIFPTGVAVRIGKGEFSRVVSTDFLDALGHLARIQSKQ